MSLYKNENPVFFNMALESIWDNQTLKPCEIVLVIDGPLTEELNLSVSRWVHQLGSVLKTVPLSENGGLGAALNKGLEHCSNDLVARMDTDDISLPFRFEQQIDFMNKNPGISVSSSWIEEYDHAFNELLSIRKVPELHDDILRFAKRRNPLSHPVVIFRKSAVLKVGGYPEFRKAQDYALWTLLLKNGYKMGNLPIVLLKMRTGDHLMTRRSLSYLKHEIDLILFQKKIGFLGYGDFFINIGLRSAFRLPPTSIKRWLYKSIRKG